MLTDFQRKKFRTLFTHLDSNGNGVLQWRDIMFHMDSIKAQKAWTDEHPRFIQLLLAETRYWDKMLERIDTDRNGVISPEEFEAFYDSVAQEILTTGEVPPWTLELLLAKFRVLDLNGDDSISIEEYTVYLKAVRSQADPQEVFNRLDLNGDGELALDELSTLFRQFVLSDDPAEPGNYLLCGTIG